MKTNYKSYTTEKFIHRAKEKHGDLYDYSNVDYTCAISKVKIVCSTHGPFLIQPRHHINGVGCKKCTAVKMSVSQRKNQATFIEQCVKMHGDKYDYSKVEYVNDKTKVVVICQKHQSQFEAHPTNLIRDKHGCPKCNESKGERKIRLLLESFNLNYVEQKVFKECKAKKPLRFDFYLPSHNLCIEYDGRQHYVPMSYSKRISAEQNLANIRTRDHIKDDFCLSSNIRLLRIRFDEEIETKLRTALEMS